MKKTLLGTLCFSTMVLGLITQPVEARQNRANEIDSECRSQGRDPATPAADEGCQLCHDAGGSGGPGDGRNAILDDDIDFFCAVVNVGGGDDDDDDDDDDNDDNDDNDDDDNGGNGGDDNTPPAIEPVGNKTGEIEVELSFTVAASDADDDNIILSASGLPTGADFQDNSNGTGTFSWTPNANQNGTFPVTFTATDDGNPVETDSESINITVGAVANQPPVLDPIGPQIVDVNATLEMTLSATDEDNNALLFSVNPKPNGADLVDNNNGTAVFTWTPDADDEGNHRLIFSVIDDGVPVQLDSEEVLISVGDVNRPPVLTSIGNHVIEVGSELNLTINATDNDGDAVALTANSVPEGATFADNGDNTAAFIWTPDANDIGNHSVAFTATDDGAPNETDQEEIVISVTAPGGVINHRPVLNTIGNHIVKYNETLELTIAASDPDGDELEISSDKLPQGATLVNNGNGTGTFTYKPGEDNIGNHYATITVKDNGTPQESIQETFLITVDDGTGVNVAPELDRIGFHLMAAGETMELTLRAVDPNGDDIIFLGFGMPDGATLTDNSDGTATLNWTPDDDDVGLHPMAIAAMDNGSPSEGDAEITFIQVGNATDGNDNGDGIDDDTSTEEEPNLVITQARIYDQRFGDQLLSVKGVYQEDTNGGSVVVTDADTGDTLVTADMNGLGQFRISQRIDDDEIPCEIIVRFAGESVQQRVVNGICRRN
ncbi:MAG: tandem-95 repeat protein [Exilibacterium sp.]